MNSDAEDAQQWLLFAEQDLRQAELILGQPDFIPRHVAWLAQQAAEKAVKAVLISWSVTFPRTHDLDALVRRLPDDSGIHSTNVDLARLTEYAVEARYPGDWPDLDPDDAAAAVADAKRILAAAREDLVT